jgi:hypothetical protein
MSCSDTAVLMPALIHDAAGPVGGNAAEPAADTFAAAAAPPASAAPAVPASPINQAALALAAQLRAATRADDAQGVTFEALQELISALCVFYAADVEQRGAITPLNTLAGASPTAVLMTTTALLRGANLELFELGMWQSWSGMK